MTLRSQVLGDDYARTRSGLLVPPDSAPKPKPVAVDLFAGAGGFSCGFHMAGWRVAAAVEYDTAAAATYLVNLGSPGTTVWTGPGIDDTLATGDVVRDPDAWTPARCADILTQDGHPIGGTGWIANQPDEPACEHLFQGDIRHLSGDLILNALGMRPGEIDAVIGGPPCQGFSRAGKRNVMDPRNSLVFDFARIVCELQPKTFVMENVSGIVDMLTPEGVPVLDALCLVFENGGFGAYEALRRSLYGSADAIAAIKGKPAAKAKRQAEQAVARSRERQADQDVLF